jgi:hypothetical protein
MDCWCNRLFPPLSGEIQSHATLQKKMNIKKAVAISFITVVPLTIAFYLTDSIVLFYVLFPGAVVSLLITGGHGGTGAEEAIAQVAGGFVNVLILSVLLRGAARVLRRNTGGI